MTAGTSSPLTTVDTPMPSPKLVAIITALTCLAGARGVYAAYTLDQLATIERLIVSKDCGALRSYIDQYPSLLEGEDALADELRSFASGVDTGLISCLSYRPGPTARNDMQLAAGPGSVATGQTVLDFGGTLY
jgi:hypothetical protein